MAVALLGVTIACEDATGPAPRRAPIQVDPAWVTGAAATGVDAATGLFILPLPPSTLTLAGAESAAVAYIRLSLHPQTWGNGREGLEEDRGAPVAAWDQLLPCGRRLVVRSPFGEVPPQAPVSLRRYVGQAWSIPLCAPSGELQVAMQVADARSGARFDGADYVLEDIDSIAQMHLDVGVPRSWEGAIMPSPEGAVKAFFERTGMPVAQVPRPRLHWAPLVTVASFPSWELDPVSGVSGAFDDGSPTGPLLRVYARLYTIDSIGFYVPAEEQPAELWLPYPVSVDPFAFDSVAIPVVEPIMLRRVHFE